MTPEEYKHGHGSFWVQFTCGAVLGVFFAVPLARKFGDSFAVGALIFLAVVGICALAAGFWGDRFWEALIRIWGWTGRRWFGISHQRALNMPNQSWYSVRSVFRSDMIEDGKPRRAFEERVVLFRATSFGEALAKGESEAKCYAADSHRCAMLDHLVAFHIHDEDLREGDEVWSCIRDLDITDDAFLRRNYEGECCSLTNVPLEKPET